MFSSFDNDRVSVVKMNTYYTMKNYIYGRYVRLTCNRKEKGKVENHFAR